MLSINDFLGYVKSQKFYNKQIVHIEEIPPKPAEFGALDIPVHNSLLNWLTKRIKYKNNEAKEFRFKAYFLDMCFHYILSNSRKQ